MPHIISKYAGVFIALFQNEAYKVDFLNLLGSHKFENISDTYQAIYDMGLRYGVLQDSKKVIEMNRSCRADSSHRGSADSKATITANSLIGLRRP